MTLPHSPPPRGVSEFPIGVEIPLQWGDQDAYGHVNNAVYIRWLESARMVYLDRVGLHTEPSGLSPILAAIHCNYRDQLKYPDTVWVGARVGRIGKTSITLEHVVYSVNLEKPVADGQSVAVVFDYELNESVVVPEQLRAAIRELEPSFEP